MTAPDRTYDQVRFHRGSRGFAAFVTGLNAAILLGLALFVTPTLGLTQPASSWFVIVVGAAAIGHIAGTKCPCPRESRDIVATDVGQRRVAHSARITPISRPLTVTHRQSRGRVSHTTVKQKQNDDEAEPFHDDADYIRVHQPESPPVRVRPCPSFSRTSDLIRKVNGTRLGRAHGHMHCSICRLQ